MLAQAKPVIPAPEASLGYVLSSRLVARVRMKGPISLPTCEVFCFFFLFKVKSYLAFQYWDKCSSVFGDCLWLS